MLTRRTVATGIGSSLLLPRPLRAFNLPVLYDMIPVAGRYADAISYNVTSWQNISYAASCFTCHTTWLPPNLPQANFARAVVCLSGPGTVRLVSFYYDQNGNRVYDRTWPSFTCLPQYGVQDVAAVLTAKINQLASLPGYQYFSAEVIGAGTVYMIRLEIDWP